MGERGALPLLAGGRKVGSAGSGAADHGNFAALVGVQSHPLTLLRIAPLLQVFVDGPQVTVGAFVKVPDNRAVSGVDGAGQR